MLAGLVKRHRWGESAVRATWQAVRVREKYKSGRGNPFFTISKSPTGVKQISDCLKMSIVRGANGCNRKKEISLSACTAGHAGAVHTKHAWPPWFPSTFSTPTGAEWKLKFGESPPLCPSPPPGSEATLSENLSAVWMWSKRLSVHYVSITKSSQRQDCRF